MNTYKNTPISRTNIVIQLNWSKEEEEEFVHNTQLFKKFNQKQKSASSYVETSGEISVNLKGGGEAWDNNQIVTGHIVAWCI